MDYGQFCPVAKAASLLAERWTLLVVRELLRGSRRFTELQNGLSKISPTVLTKRLNQLCDAGVIARRRIAGHKRGHEYYLTDAGRELDPIIKQLGAWGMRWARERLTDSDLDAYLLISAMGQRIDARHLKAGETVLQFKLTDTRDRGDWWLVVSEQDVDLCTDDPGKEVDVLVTSDLRTLTEIWMGDVPLAVARGDGRLRVSAPPALLRDLSSWFPVSVYAAGRASASGISRPPVQ